MFEKMTVTIMIRNIINKDQEKSSFTSKFWMIFLTLCFPAFLEHHYCCHITGTFRYWQQTPKELFVWFSRELKNQRLQTLLYHKKGLNFFSNKLSWIKLLTRYMLSNALNVNFVIFLTSYQFLKYKYSIKHIFV